jgi:hypothetical protein
VSGLEASWRASACRLSMSRCEDGCGGGREGAEEVDETET